MHTLIGLYVRHTLNKCYLQVLRHKRYAENRVKIRPVDVEIIGPTEIVKEERQDREGKHMAIRSIVPSAIVPSYNMDLTITSKPTFYHDLH